MTDSPDTLAPDEVRLSDGRVATVRPFALVRARWRMRVAIVAFTHRMVQAARERNCTSTLAPSW